MKFKHCYVCKKYKSTDNFYSNKSKNDGLASECKSCNKEKGKKFYKENKEVCDKKTKQRILSKPYLKTLDGIKTRCNNTKNHKYPRYGGRGIECRITEEELENLWFRDKAYEMKRPSIDRIDNDGHYEFKNCRFIELSENSLKMNLEKNAKSVYQIDKNTNNIINEFISISQAERQTSITNISKVLRGICKSVGGYYWKYK